MKHIFNFRLFEESLLSDDIEKLRKKGYRGLPNSSSEEDKEEDKPKIKDIDKKPKSKKIDKADPSEMEEYIKNLKDKGYRGF